jgi:BirA family transcriptional regulator, biotin operon repressor / biotin---[acetyl-CoA-carboxylase] ligase
MSAQDLLLPYLIHSQLNTRRFGKNIFHHSRVTSTNDLAHDLAKNGAEEGTLVLAEEQTKGRGRLARSWFSEKNSGIYASLILRPKMKPCYAAVLNLAAAVAASEAVEQVCGLASDIKWPNDLLVNGRKCCGILTEMSTEPEEIRYIIAGIGINVNQHQFPQHLSQQASSLLLEGKQRYSRIELLCRLLESFEQIYQELQSGSRAEVMKRWVCRSSYASGKSVSVDLGGRKIHGVTAGLSETGGLHVRMDDGRVEEVLSGDVVAWG